jgi:hypothetical protein
VHTGNAGRERTPRGSQSRQLRLGRCGQPSLSITFAPRLLG